MRQERLNTGCRICRAACEIKHLSREYAGRVFPVFTRDQPSRRGGLNAGYSHVFLGGIRRWHDLLRLLVRRHVLGEAKIR